MHNNNLSTLFNLIHALNKGEKRYFKLYVNSRSSHVQNKNYLKLFTAIERQKEYNETKLIKLGIVKKEHLPMLKNYLYKLILESIRTLNSKKDSVTTHLQNMLDNAGILFDKHIDEEGMVILRKVKKLAIHHERWGIALDALLMEMEENLKKADLKELKVVETEMGLLLDKINNLYEYFRLRRDVTTITRKTMVKRTIQNKLLEQLLANSLLNNEHKAMSVYAKNIYYVTLLHYYVFKDDLKTASKIVSKQLHFVESNYSIINNAELFHSSLLNNLTVIQLELRKHKEALETNQKHRLLAKNSSKAKEHAFFYSMLNGTNLYIANGNFEKGIPLVKELEKNLSKIKNKVPDTAILAFYLNSAKIYLGVCDYHPAQRWIMNIINHPKLILREDIQATAHLLQIIIHYELHTPDIIEYLLVSTHRFLINRKQLYKVEESFLQFMRRLVNLTASSKELLMEFRVYREELIKILKDPKERVVLNNFDIVSWVESKIEGRAFAEVVREKITGY